MSEDFDELINSHSTRIIETKNKSLSDYDNGLKKNSNPDVFNYDLSDELKFDEDINLGEETEEIVKFENTSGENESTIEEFARLVLTEIESRNLPATPENYKFYFLEMLEREPEPFKHRVRNMLKIESPKDELIRSREIENSLQYSLKVSEQILLITAKLYNNVSIMRNIAIQRSDEATTKNVKDLVQLLKFDLEKLNDVLGRQNDSLKGLYTRAVESVNTVYKQRRKERREEDRKSVV